MKERVFTGRNSEFLDAIKRDMLMAKNIKIIVSFVMESGVKLLKETLQEVMRKGIQVEIITGTYLGITEPSALYLLKEILGKQGVVVARRTVAKYRESLNIPPVKMRKTI